MSASGLAFLGVRRLRATDCAGLALVLAAPIFAHGGSFVGPCGPGTAAPVGPGGSGPVGLPPAAPLIPSTTSSGDGALSADLTDWRLWWRYNQAPFLALKSHVHSIGTGTGTETWFLGDGQSPQRGTLRPTVEQIRTRIVPALLAVLQRETDKDLVTGAMVALAKIGDGGDPAEGARFEDAITRSLTDANQEIRETAAVSLGILASPRSIPQLAHLLWNTEEGRRKVKAAEVDYRTRSFAAYGLGLIGARAQSELDRQLVVSILRRGLEDDDTASYDLEVACLIAIGLVPLATIETPAGLSGARATPPERSRVAQLDYVLAILRDPKRETLTRAQCPITLARLLQVEPGYAAPARVPEGVAAAQEAVPEKPSADRLPASLAEARGEIARELLERIERGRERNEVVQSCVLALGEIGTNAGEDPLDARIRRVLSNVPDQQSEPQARAFSMMAAADAGARFTNPLGEGHLDAREFLARQVYDGKSYLRPWAGLAAGVLCWRLADQEAAQPTLETLRRALRNSLDDERAHERIGAYALAAGLARSHDSAGRLAKLLDKQLPDELRGQVALGLALLGDRSAIAPLREIVAGAKYRPELLKHAAMALVVLGDGDIATQLAVMLQEARSLASQAAIATALGYVGDRRSVDPLLKLLGDRLSTEKARAFAAVALGNVADKELLPWNAKIGFGLNYRAAPATLSDPLSGTGILDFL